MTKLGWYKEYRVIRYLKNQCNPQDQQTKNKISLWQVMPQKDWTKFNIHL